MATVKATFTLDSEALASLERATARTRQSKSAVVREAINDYAQRADKLTSEEKARKLRALEKLLSRTATRSQAEVDQEIAEIRAARRGGGRRTPVE